MLYGRRLGMRDSARTESLAWGALRRPRGMRDSAGTDSDFAWGCFAIFFPAAAARADRYQFPVFGIEDHGSFGGSGLPFCSSSTDCLSGERTNAMLPSRGGRLMVTPPFISFSQVA